MVLLEEHPREKYHRWVGSLKMAHLINMIWANIWNGKICQNFEILKKAMCQWQITNLQKTVMTREVVSMNFPLVALTDYRN